MVLDSPATAPVERNKITRKRLREKMPRGHPPLSGAGPSRSNEMRLVSMSHGHCGRAGKRDGQGSAGGADQCSVQAVPHHPRAPEVEQDAGAVEIGDEIRTGKQQTREMHVVFASRSVHVRTTRTIKSTVLDNSVAGEHS